MRVSLVLGLVILLAAARSARADDGEPAFTIGPTTTWVLLGGVTTGGTVALADRGYFVGGELSLAHLREGSFAGLYTDGYYDWGAGGTYVTGGLELGHKFIGLDGGVALRFENGDRAVGGTGRISIGIGVASVYGRYMHFASGPGDNVIQVGVQLKLPLATFGGRP